MDEQQIRQKMGENPNKAYALYLRETGEPDTITTYKKFRKFKEQFLNEYLGKDVIDWLYRMEWREKKDE